MSWMEASTSSFMVGMARAGKIANSKVKSSIDSIVLVEKASRSAVVCTGCQAKVGSPACFIHPGDPHLAATKRQQSSSLWVEPSPISLTHHDGP